MHRKILGVQTGKSLAEATRTDGEEPVGQPAASSRAATAVGRTRPPVELIPGTLDMRMLEAFSRAPHHRYLGHPR